MTQPPRLSQTVLDARDACSLAEFYRELLGLVCRPGDEPPTDGNWKCIESATFRLQLVPFGQHLE